MKTKLLLSFVVAMLLSATTAIAAITVSNTNDSGTGSLREAINSSYSGDTINFSNELAGKTITLQSILPRINRNLTIEGNGITVSGNDNSGILDIRYPGGFDDIIINISRVHFTHGKGISYNGNNVGGAIFVANYMIVNLQSCIFSFNSADYDGSAIFNNGTLSIKGCTFYNNGANSIYSTRYYDGGVTLTGNLFYNNAISGGDALYGTGFSSGGYNTYDKNNANFTFNGTGDEQVITLTFNETDFTPTVAGISLLSQIPAGLAGFPELDFYGKNRNENQNVSGAVTGIKNTSIDMIKTQQLTVYPNPTQGLIYIENANREEVSVYNLAGKLLLRTGENSIDLSDYLNGIYMLKIGNKAAKVVKL